MKSMRLYEVIIHAEILQSVYFILSPDECELGEKRECLVCLNDESCGTECETCHKWMHIDCLKKWFNSNDMRTCPHCRHKWKFVMQLKDKEGIFTTKGYLTGSIN